MHQYIEGCEHQHENVAEHVRPGRRRERIRRLLRKSIRPATAASSPMIRPTVTSHAEKSAHIILAVRIGDISDQRTYEAHDRRWHQHRMNRVASNLSGGAHIFVIFQKQPLQRRILNPALQLFSWVGVPKPAHATFGMPARGPTCLYFLHDLRVGD